MFDNYVIMAGGSGSRLWPASNARLPKQFLPVGKNGTESFFSLTLERALSCAGSSGGKIIIIAGEAHVAHVIAACSRLGSAEKKRLVLIPEPAAKNTAPAIACAVTYAETTGGENQSMLVLTSDHVIKPVTAFKRDVAVALRAARENRLVVFGIPPARPETGYGYIKAAGVSGAGVYDVAAFCEKPDLKTAKRFVASGKYFWNSGMFAFDCSFLTGEYCRLVPEVMEPFLRLKAPDNKAYRIIQGVRVLDNWAGLKGAYNQSVSISFDYAIAVKSRQSAMVRARFEWIDVGCWDDYSALLANDSKNNAAVFTAGNCANYFVDSDIPVALVDINDCIVVIRSGKDGALPSALIVKKGESQKVRDIVDVIKRSGRTDIV